MSWTVVWVTYRCIAAGYLEVSTGYMAQKVVVRSAEDSHGCKWTCSLLSLIQRIPWLGLLCTYQINCIIACGFFTINTCTAQDMHRIPTAVVEEIQT
jgi:hypothetical protein